MKKLYILIALSLLASSCQKSIEDRAEQEAREYTEKLCPTPIQNYTRTDSLTFDRESKTFNYYTSLFDLMDDEDFGDDDLMDDEEFDDDDLTGEDGMVVDATLPPDNDEEDGEG